MAEYRLPTVEGRELLIRPCVAASRPQLQVAVLSSRGNIMEAATIEAGDILGLCRGVAKVCREANERFARAQKAEKVAAAARYTAALARNPWLNGEKGVFPDETYIGRPR
ncbi:MAG TPA: hypothetical protein VNY83_00985 [Solirubrobacterales bacterium]|jgi:hypothetical protein|nr:hypothetical protein [Solirubrobacterales bacterium]